LHFQSVLRLDYHYQMSPWISSLIAIAIVSGIPLAVTLLLASRERTVRAFIPQLTALGSGALLGAAVFHLIPESLEGGRGPLAVFVAVVVGYLSFALIERILASHDHAHSHGLELGAPPARHPNTCETVSGLSPSDAPVHRGHKHADAAHDHSDHSHHQHDHGAAHKAPAGLVPLAFVGDALHNLVDGMLIAAGFLTDPSFGFLTAVAIGLHELPREIGTFGLFVHGGVHPMRAVAYNVVTAVISFAGAAITLLVGAHAAELGENILPFAAGSYLYIAFAVGIPAFARQGSSAPRLARVGALVGGFALMAVSAAL
jgi:zinc and cadmium transporter